MLVAELSWLLLRAVLAVAGVLGDWISEMGETIVDAKDVVLDP